MRKKWLCGCASCRSQRRLDRYRNRMDRKVLQVQNNQCFSIAVIERGVQ